MRFFIVTAVVVFALSCGRDSGKTGEAGVTDSVVTGVKKILFADGTVRAEIPMKDGRRHGLAKEYHRNGKVFQELNYNNGIKEGEARQYYEGGPLAQITPYSKGKRSGVQRRYRADGTLSAEVTFNNDEPCRGLVEYTLKGEKKKKYPTIVIEEVNRILASGKFLVVVSMSDKTNAVEFFEGKLAQGGCFDPKLAIAIDKIGPGRSALEFDVAPGTFSMQQLNIIAKVRTALGNTYLTERAHNLSIEYR